LVGFGRWGRPGGGRRGGRGGNGRFATKNFKHDDATSGTFPLDRFPSVLHYFLDGLDYFFLCFALNTISFSHKLDWEKTASGRFLAGVIV
jgi:hypothetical protein